MEQKSPILKHDLLNAYLEEAIKHTESMLGDEKDLYKTYVFSNKEDCTEKVPKTPAFAEDCIDYAPTYACDWIPDSQTTYSIKGILLVTNTLDDQEESTIDDGASYLMYTVIPKNDNLVMTIDYGCTSPSSRRKGLTKMLRVALVLAVKQYNYDNPEEQIKEIASLAITSGSFYILWVLGFMPTSQRNMNLLKYDFAGGISDQVFLGYLNTQKNIERSVIEKFEAYTRMNEKTREKIPGAAQMKEHANKLIKFLKLPNPDDYVKQTGNGLFY